MTQPAFDFDEEPEGSLTYRVGELADAINQALRRRFDHGVWVRGEIQGYREQGPHTYFSLVDTDDDGRKATLAVSLFGAFRNRLRPLLHRAGLYPLHDGLAARIYGELDFYAGNGRLSLKMTGVDPRYTLGELTLRRDALVRRLVAEGLFDRQRALAVAPAPCRVGVVASVGSAAWHDLTHELESGGYGFHLAVVDTRVQGDAAPDGVAAAITTLARRDDLDVIVVVRGGGARSELATFDAEPIARAIVASPVPVLTGLGHEIDRSVADDVAHLALKTPTACGAWLVERVRAYAEASEACWREIGRRAAHHLSRADERTTALAHRAADRTRAGLSRAEERLDRHVVRLPVAAALALDRQRAVVATLAGRTPVAARRHAAAAEARVADLAARLHRRAPQVLGAEERALDERAARVRLLDPAHALARGWSITHTADGRLVRHVADLRPGEEIETRLLDGRVRSRVTDTEETP